MKSSNYQSALEVLSKVRNFYLGLHPYAFEGLRGEDLEEAKSVEWVKIYSELLNVIEYDRNRRVTCGECHKKILP